ncbi:THAP domain-containing protein 1-like [Centruroides vittatus]|uniref:THAP domain-containing protein 1-like n=1 Tax=Centruroides vittatus TaxID=120091 RepID=UPI00350F166F
MAACKGNYATGPKVIGFSFPLDEVLRQKWISAIHGDNFVPTKQSVVCELHFHPDDIERSTSMYDPKSGKLLTVPLDQPRIKKGAVPSLLPGCPSYLSKSASKRENPEDR